MSEPMTLQDLADQIEAGFRKVADAWNGAIAKMAQQLPTEDADATRPPGECPRTGTGGPDAPGASEGLDAAIEAGYTAITDADPWFGTDQDHWRHAGLAVRAAEPILRQAVAEDIARRLIEVGRDPHRNLAWMYPEQAAEIAREVGRGQ